MSKFAFFLVSSVFSLNLFAASAALIPGKYAVDPAHTRVSFVVPHFVVSEVEGRFNDVKGEFVLKENFTKSTLTATVATTSIDTAVQKRDDHLRSDDFFGVKKYPEMKMVVKSITGTPESFKAVVALTIKDVTKPITFDGKYTGAAKDPWGGQRAAFQMNGVINRKDFHINYADKIDIGPAVGDEVKIRIWAEGVLAADPKAKK